MRKSRKRGTLPRAESQKRLNRFKLFRDEPNLSRFDACGELDRPRFRLFDSMSLHRKRKSIRDIAYWVLASLAWQELPPQLEAAAYPAIAWSRSSRAYAAG